MRKKLSLSALEKKVDRIFSEFIRRKEAGQGGTVECVTCGKKMHWKESHAGHFVKRQHRATRWLEENVNVQCVACNTFNGGRQDEYASFILKKYGLYTFNEIMTLKHTTRKYTRVELGEMIDFYRQKLELLRSL